MLRTLALLLAAAPVAVAAPVPKGGGGPKLYFPTAVGTKWVYEREAGGDEAVEVSEVEKSDGGWVVSRRRSDGQGNTYHPITVSAAGLTQPQPTADGEAVGTVWLLKSGATAGDTWAVSDGKRTFVGTEQVKVPAGTYTAAKVVWVAADGERVTQWYAPGVGEVKKVRTDADGTTTVLRALKSFTPGK